MARYRSIRPELWSTEQFVELSPNARLLYIGLWNFCDDGGNHPASPKSAKMEIFPGDDITAAAIAQLIEEIKKQNLLTLYEAKNAQYWHINDWRNLQKIEKPTYYHPTFAEQSPSSRRAVGEIPQTNKQEENKQTEGESSAHAHEGENQFQKNTSADTPAQLRDQLAAFYANCPDEWQTAILRDADGSQYPEPKLHAIIQKFCAHRIEKGHGHETYAAQNAALQKWIADEKNHENRPAPNGKHYNGKTEYPITDPEEIKKILQKQHPTAAARFTAANIQTLAKAPNEATFCEWAANIAKKIHNGRQDKATPRTGETTLASALPSTVNRQPSTVE